ncbi:hypothetical protein JJQ72_15305 [Paenibacillus sp. F411]|uniref:hypothetical protein n=1 Tax=Paenibacillus sp. F411 TaxID=2820239 RepID=UPI001AAF46C1|nr:hypothetical protein [Paenibacillus sp. F411]MBO2945342.1 hypothetical protein [Paenibacillus sp. F411]
MNDSHHNKPNSSASVYAEAILRWVGHYADKASALHEQDQVIAVRISTRQLSLLERLLDLHAVQALSGQEPPTWNEGSLLELRTLWDQLTDDTGLLRPCRSFWISIQQKLNIPAAVNKPKISSPSSAKPAKQSSPKKSSKARPNPKPPAALFISTLGGPSKKHNPDRKEEAAFMAMIGSKKYNIKY